MAVIVPFESPSGASIDQLVGLVAADMARVNATILSRTGSEVTMIPEVANHLISSGGKRLRPMLTLAMANLTGYSGDGHIKLAASVEFMHTATLLHDDVVDESELRRGKLSARMLWGNEALSLIHISHQHSHPSPQAPSVGLSQSSSTKRMSCRPESMPMAASDFRYSC